MHLRRIDIDVRKAPAPERYPFRLPVIRDTDRIELEAPVAFFIGENGSGKSTLLRAIARRCGIHIWKPEDWTRVDGNPYEDRLNEFIHVRWADAPVPGSYFEAEIARHFAEYLDEWAATDPGMLDYFGGASLLIQSHGQSLMSFFRSRYRFRGLYLLDEPESALSPKSLLEMVRLLRNESTKGHAQFIIATHSPILMACPGAVIYSFDHAPIRTVAYAETEHYRLYRAFMFDPGAFLKE